MPLFGPGGMSKLIQKGREKRKKLAALWERSASAGGAMLHGPANLNVDLLSVLSQIKIGVFTPKI